MLRDFRLQQVEKHVPRRVGEKLFIEIAGTEPPSPDDLSDRLQRYCGDIAFRGYRFFQLRFAGAHGQSRQRSGNATHFVR